jgi:hypothetical protein
VIGARLKRAGRALAWAFRSPGMATRHSEWLFQELGMSGLFWRTRYRGAKILVPRPELVDRECRPLQDPPLVPAGGAGHMRDDDVVLGVSMDGDVRAYPWWIMDNHHVANDTVGGRPVVVLLCEMCSTGVAFDPVVGGRRLTFEQRHIFNGTITLDDRETGSVWSPYLGTAIRGPLEGKRMGMVPLWQMEWRAWREMHPDTRVLADGLGSREGHGSNHTIGSPQVGPGMRRSMARWDDRLPHNTLVLGVTGNGGGRAYPLEALRKRSGVIEDVVGGVPIVAFLHVAEGSYGAAAYDRRLGGTTLTFEPGPGGPVDRETGSLWNVEGRAESGPLAGRALRFVPSHVSEWYIWATNFPGIDIAG